MENTQAIKYIAYFLAMAIAAFGGTAADKIQTPMIQGPHLWNHL